jgi:hypothetical protein
MATCSDASPKAPRGKFSKKKKGMGEVGGVSWKKTKSLESCKKKCKAYEVASDAEIQAASGLDKMGQKKAKRAIKKIVTAEVRRVPSAFLMMT